MPLPPVGVVVRRTERLAVDGSDPARQPQGRTACSATASAPAPPGCRAARREPAAPGAHRPWCRAAACAGENPGICEIQTLGLQLSQGLPLPPESRPRSLCIMGSSDQLASVPRVRSRRTPKSLELRRRKYRRAHRWVYFHQHPWLWCRFGVTTPLPMSPPPTERRWLQRTFTLSALICGNLRRSCTKPSLGPLTPSHNQRHHRDPSLPIRSGGLPQFPALSSRGHGK